MKLTVRSKVALIVPAVQDMAPSIVKANQGAPTSSLYMRMCLVCGAHALERTEENHSGAPLVFIDPFSPLQPCPICEGIRRASPGIFEWLVQAIRFSQQLRAFVPLEHYEMICKLEVKENLN